jgi:acyl carrier protein
MNTMSDAELFDAITGILDGYSRIDKKDMTLDTPIEELGIDSLFAMGVSCEIRKQLGVDLGNEDLANILWGGHAPVAGALDHPNEPVYRRGPEHAGTKGVSSTPTINKLLTTIKGKWSSFNDPTSMNEMVTAL